MVNLNELEIRKFHQSVKYFILKFGLFLQICLFSMIFSVLLFASLAINANEFLSKEQKDALDIDCKKQVKKGNYNSKSKCKKLLVASIKKDGILIDLFEFDETDQRSARINCSQRIKKGFEVYNACLAMKLNVDIAIDPRPDVLKNDGSGDKETDEEIINVADNVYNEVAPASYSVCVIESQEAEYCGACGSAVVIEEDLLATNCHVVYHVNEETFEITNKAWKIIEIINVKKDPKNINNWKQATIFKSDRNNDRCVVKTNNSLNVNPVRIKKYSDIKMLEKVFAVGSPECKHGVMTAGEIQNKYDFGYGSGPMSFDIPVLQTNAHIRGGSSGGGLFDTKGNLIGITTLGDSEEKANPFNIAVSADNFTELID